MLEVVNGYLLVYFLGLCTLSALVSYLVNPIASFFSRPSSNERKTWDDIKKLKSEQKSISMKDEFAAYSKIQRKINKLEVALKENSQSRINKTLAIKGTVQVVLQAVVALIIVLSVIWNRREPIVVLKGKMFPLTAFLQYPSDMPNAVSTHMWVLISNLSIRAILKPVLS